jgi:hypothetical protein
MRARFAAAVAVASLITMSCGGIVDPSQNQVQTFSGTIAPGGGGQAAHAFTAANGGELTVKITALSPITQTYIGVAWTQAASDGSCNGAVLFSTNFAQLNVPAISGANIVSGKYCIVVYDIGVFTVPETYTVSVSHP